MPRLARLSDRLAVVRSTRLAESHDMLPLAGGRAPGRLDLPPNIGSIVARHRPGSGVPSFVSVAPLSARRHGFGPITAPGHGGGTLGSACHPFIVTCSADGRTGIAGENPADELSEEQRSRQLEERSALLDSGAGLRALDPLAESDRTRNRYGRTSFGQSLLLGRRLVEAGVACVQVNWSLGVDGAGSEAGWDLHRNAFGQLRDHHGPILDRALSALIGDLSDRGLLETTLVVAMGEMGRTPGINRAGGRDHWPTCSTVWAGAGVRGGRVVGETDETGAGPITTPISALMIATTIAELAGVDASSRAKMGVLEGGRVIRELF